MYKPLPPQLRLGFSDIHDIGVFAKEVIPHGTNLGMTHITIEENTLCPNTSWEDFSITSDDAELRES